MADEDALFLGGAHVIEPGLRKTPGCGAQFEPSAVLRNGGLETKNHRARIGEDHLADSADIVLPPEVIKTGPAPPPLPYLVPPVSPPSSSQWHPSVPCPRLPSPPPPSPLSPLFFPSYSAPWVPHPPLCSSAVIYYVRKNVPCRLLPWSGNPFPWGRIGGGADNDPDFITLAMNHLHSSVNYPVYCFAGSQRNSVLVLKV